MFVDVVESRVGRRRRGMLSWVLYVISVDVSVAFLIYFAHTVERAIGLGIFGEIDLAWGGLALSGRTPAEAASLSRNVEFAGTSIDDFKNQ